MRVLSLFSILLFASQLKASDLLQERGHYFKEFANMILTLGFVLVLAFVALYFVKKLMRSRLKQLNKSTAIRILERRSLNPKASIYLIDVLGKGMVIGESPAGINLLTEFPDGQNVEELLSSFQDEVQPKVSFPEVLQKKMNGLFNKNDRAPK